MIESGHMPAENGKYALLQKCSEEVAGWWTALHGPIRPALAQLKDQRKSQSQQQRHWWFNGWGAYMSEARSWGDTLLCAADGSGQDMVVHFTTSQGEGEFTSYKGIDIRWAH